MKKQSVMLKDNYLVLQAWMVRDLGLKGNAAIIYALIYGFSQAEGQACTCGDEYMAAWINGDPRTVINIKNSLIADGLIEKVEGFDGDQRYSGYRVVHSKICEKVSPKSLQIPNKTGEKSSRKDGRKQVKKIPEIGEDFSPDNINNNFQTDKSVCQSPRACAREDGTDGLTEKEFYAECIFDHWKKLKSALWGDDSEMKSWEYEKRLNDVVAELKRLDTVSVNGSEIPAAQMLKNINELFADATPDKLLAALVSGCAPEIKKKFNYTVTALYNAAKQF